MPEVVIVGGGATGTGIARDLAMRGVDVTLIERGSLAHGTTGHTHGVLHSGGRYAVSNPQSARDCYAENQVLRRIASHCIDASEGLFVQLPADSPDYFRDKLRACRNCGIPVEQLDPDNVRTLEPALAEHIEGAFSIPDGVIDPFRLCAATAAAAEAYGARIETHTEVTDLSMEDDSIVGVRVQPTGGSDQGSYLPAGSSEELRPDHVVNATGPWVGHLGRQAGVEVPVRYSKGAMVVMNFGDVSRVVNRCRPKSEGDIILPRETMAVLGTTDREVDTLDSYSTDPRATDFLIEELSALVPGLQNAQTIHSYWGIRSLYDPEEISSQPASDLSRDFCVFDHAERDGLRGFTSIVGGKLTTHRLMAEQTSDVVCAKLGINEESRTDAVPLPGQDDPSLVQNYMEKFDIQSPLGG